MKYHNILHDDMRNGIGLRVTLFLSGCENKCEGCQNPQTWDENSGIYYDIDAHHEIMNALAHPYIHGITISGGDPLHPANAEIVCGLCMEIKKRYPTKSIWLYTGYVFENLYISPADWTTCDVDPVRDARSDIMKYIDVLVDGKFVRELADVNYHWAGSTNQRVIDVPATLKNGKVVLYEQE